MMDDQTKPQCVSKCLRRTYLVPQLRVDLTLPNNNIEKVNICTFVKKRNYQVLEVRILHYMIYHALKM